MDQKLCVKEITKYAAIITVLRTVLNNYQQKSLAYRLQPVISINFVVISLASELYF